MRIINVEKSSVVDYPPNISAVVFLAGCNMRCSFCYNKTILDPETKALKTAKLAEIVAAAKQRDLPFSVGTEMNNYGQKFVDTFDAPEIAPYAADFRDGAYVLYGHTLLQRALGKGMVSEWARSEFGLDRRKANAFYLEVGRLGFPPGAAWVALSQLPRNCDAQSAMKALEALR